MASREQTQLGLIQSILKQPGEDAPRLIYADWLEENGDPSLAELIRLQLEMEQPWMTRARKRHLRRRERELLDGLNEGCALSTEDVSEPRYGGIPSGWSYAIVGGVPLLWIETWETKSIPLPPREWVERFGGFTVHVGFYDDWKSHYELHAETLQRFFAWPFATRCLGLDMGDVEKHYGDCISLIAEWPGRENLLRIAGVGFGVLASPTFRGIADVEAERNITKEAITSLVAMPELRRLRASLTSVEPEALPVLASLSSLRELSLTGQFIEDELAHALATGSMRELVRLDLARTRITDHGAVALLRSPNLPNLRMVNLPGTQIGLPTIEELCKTDRLFQCGRVNLHPCELGDEAFSILAHSPHAQHLRVLSVYSELCTDKTAFAMATSPHLKNLIKLSLKGGQIGPDGAEKLTSGDLPELQELSLPGNPIQDRGTLAIAKFNHSNADPNLELSKTSMTADGVKQLAASGYLAGVEMLSLDSNLIGDAGVISLANCPDLASLESLGLWETGMTDEGARALLESPYLPNRLGIRIYGNDISEAIHNALRERFR